MNTLWASLLGLMVIALAVVVVFNLLQGRQTRLRDAWRQKLSAASGGSAPPASDPAPDTPVPSQPSAASGAPAVRVEPTFGPSPVVQPVDAAPGESEPTLSAADPSPSQAAAAEPSLPGAGSRPLARDDVAGPILDPRLDCIVAFGLSAPIAPERLLAAVSGLRRAGSKPVAVEADIGDGRWTVPTASSPAIRRVRAGVLLANRLGALNAMEFSEFATAMIALGQSIGAGGAIVPEMAGVLEHARQLDDACARLDAVIGLTVETPTALSPADLAALAEGLGLQERGNNRFAALGDEGEVLFSLALGDRAEQLTLLLDVPRAPEYAQPWARMVEAARLCASHTGGRVVDDANRVMNDAAAGRVSSQLVQCYESLREAGLDAGSPPALRVFN